MEAPEDLVYLQLNPRQVSQLIVKVEPWGEDTNGDANLETTCINAQFHAPLKISLASLPHPTLY
jgi:hypothetical protein